MIVIPVDQLNDDTLVALIEEFVTRDGTDYGEQEIALARKVEQVKAQLARGEVLIVYDPGQEQANLVTREQYRQLQQHG